MAGRTCTICAHPQRADIDKAILRDEPYRAIACQFDVSREAVRRHHKGGHVSEKLIKADRAREIARADNLLAEMQALQGRTLSLLEKAEGAGEHRTAIAAIREARANLEFLGRLAGEIADQQVVNVFVNPQWLTIRGVVLDALRDYPDARALLVDRLAEVDP